jgi:aldehyde:ferredoxin oxidoreductase
MKGGMRMASTTFGFTGRVLHVDLARREVHTESLPAETMRIYGGGSLLAARLLLQTSAPGADTMAGDGSIVFASSVVAGFPFVGLPRFSVCGRSPLTGGFGEARCEGSFANGLKKSGYDAIVFSGRAPDPVIVRIGDAGAEFADAKDLWGLETGAATAQLRQRFGTSAHTAVIGPAGEARVRYAAICADLHHQATASGMGAAMGAKQLKAVVLSGGLYPPVADPGLCAELTASYRARMALNPLTAWQKDPPGFSAWVELHGLDAGLCVENFSTADYSQARAYRPDAIMAHFVGTSPCPGCPNDCIKIMQPEDGGPGRGIHQPIMGALGPNIGIWDPAFVVRANLRCQELGLDPVSLGFTLSMAMECKRRGIGSDTVLDTVPEFGDSRGITQLIEDIGHRVGIGELLAEGSRRLGMALGDDAGDLAMQVKGQEMPPIEPRTQTNLALGYAVSPVGPRLDICEHDWDFDTEVGWPHTLDYSRAIGIGERIPMDELSVRKVRNYKALSALWSALDALNICIYAGPPTRALNLEDTARLVEGVTGWDMSTWELMRLGERRFHLLRVYNVREGMSAADDTLPQRFYTERVDSGRKAGAVLDRDLFEVVKQSYYQMMGWTAQGIPRYETLVDFQLDWAAELAQSAGPGGRASDQV